MTMTIDANQQRFPLTLDHMSSYAATSQPQFSNPWVASSPATSQAGSHGMFVGAHGGLNPNPLSLDTLKHPQQPPQQRAGTGPGGGVSMAPYGSIPVTAPSAGSPLSTAANVYTGHQDLLSLPQDLLSLGRLPHQTTSAAYEAAYATAASPIHPTYAAASGPYDQLGYAPAPMRSTFAMAPEHDTRRYSQSSVSSALDPELGASVLPRNPLVDMSNHRGMQGDDRRSFADAIEASHGILSLSQDTPRPIYGSRTRNSGDAYGFPSTHSTSSSVSSNFSGYYGGSVDSSVSDYSTAGSDIESVASRTLPRPQGLMASQAPPAPQSMMSQFSSKISSSTQKKHKCKVCDKRFTRPSSLQTHMYSHTGEKRMPSSVFRCVEFALTLRQLLPAKWRAAADISRLCPISGATARSTRAKPQARRTRRTSTRTTTTITSTRTPNNPTRPPCDPVAASELLTIDCITTTAFLIRIIR